MIKIIMSIFIVATLASAESLLPPKAEVKYEMDYAQDTRCIVRNFLVYKEPKWVSKIELQNGKKLFFSSPKSMIEFYHRPGKWFHIGVKSENDFKDIVVTDYLTMKPINAREAFFVYGSRAISPAGDDLVAIEKEVDAKNFAKMYNGKRVLKFKEISASLINLINGRI